MMTGLTLFATYSSFFLMVSSSAPCPCSGGCWLSQVHDRGGIDCASAGAYTASFRRGLGELPGSRATLRSTSELQNLHRGTEVSLLQGTFTRGRESLSAFYEHLIMCVSQVDRKTEEELCFHSCPIFRHC